MDLNGKNRTSLEVSWTRRQAVALINTKTKSAAEVTEIPKWCLSWKTSKKLLLRPAEETKTFSGFPQFLRQAHQLQKGKQPVLRRQAPPPGEDSSVYFNDL